MNMKHLFIALPLLLTLSAPALAGGTSDATKTIAQIMMNLNHFPSDTEKGALRQIVDGSAATENERILATSLINMNHKASGADKPRLKTMMTNPNATESERAMAKIMLNINHQASSADKSVLRGFIK